MKEYWCIYRITNNINGKTYIGQHKYRDEDDPMKGYHGGGILLRKAYKKYGQENFSTEVLYKLIQYKETADSMEIWAIEKERKFNVNGCYNIANGGGGTKGVSPSEETRQKISKANKGKKSWNKGKTGIFSEETRKRMSESRKGKAPWNKGRTGVYSKEQLQKMSERMKGHPSPCKGKPKSAEHKRKLSEARKGKKYKPHSEETKQKMRDAWKQRKINHPITDETRKRLSESIKAYYRRKKENE